MVLFQLIEMTTQATRTYLHGLYSGAHDVVYITKQP